MASEAHALIAHWRLPLTRHTPFRVYDDGHRYRHEDVHGTRWAEQAGCHGKPVFRETEPPPVRDIW